MQRILCIMLTGLATALAAAQTPLGSAFSYQGRLTENGQPAVGVYDFVVHAYDAPVGGTALNPLAQPYLNVAVSDGVFTIEVDLGADAFMGQTCWLNILVRPASTGMYVALTPRQPLTITPHALHAQRTSQWETVNGRTTNANAGEFVGVNRATRATSAEFFGVQAPVQSGYGGMYLRTDGAAAKPFYGYSTGVQSAWTYLDGATGDWRANIGGDRLTVTDTGRVGIGSIDPTAKLQMVGGGLSDGLYVTNSGSGRAAQFQLPAGSSNHALYAANYGSGKAAAFESHVASSTPAVTAYKAGGGTAIGATGDLEVDGALRGKCGGATARLTPIAYARFRMLYTPLEVIATSPNVTVDPSSAWATVYINDESDPSTWIVLASMSFADPMVDNLGSYDELVIWFANDDSQPYVHIDADCYLRDIDACWDAGLPVGEEYFDVVVYKP